MSYVSPQLVFLSICHTVSKDLTRMSNPVRSRPDGGSRTVASVVGYLPQILRKTYCARKYDKSVPQPVRHHGSHPTQVLKLSDSRHAEKKSPQRTTPAVVYPFVNSRHSVAKYICFSLKCQAVLPYSRSKSSTLSFRHSNSSGLKQPHSPSKII